MTKAELVAIMAKHAGGSKTSAERAMNAFVGGIIDSLRRGRRVTISGFGTFVVTRRAARNGRVGHVALDHAAGVRILLPQPTNFRVAPLSRSAGPIV